jgi:hypothetical protein
MTRELAEPGKAYDKRLEATRFINLDDRSPHLALGLRGTTGGPVEASFGIEDCEDIRKRTLRTQWRRQSDPRKLTVRARRPYRGLTPLMTPAWNPDHPSLAA